MRHAVVDIAPPIEPSTRCDGEALKKGVIVVDYDPSWPIQFRSLRGKIAGVLRRMASAIEHVGSTAVPGLASKPIIDIDVLLESEHWLPDVVARLATLGYVHRGDLGIPARDAFRSPAGAPPHHLYVCPPHSPEFRRHLALRNYLRSHPKEAREYADLKRALASRFADDRDAYQAGKSDFVSKLTQRAIIGVGR
jgi:GrpB-like predicted nucleotidyltransferase (UPF0157 family)